jgi:hypothetical protein
VLLKIHVSLSLQSLAFDTSFVLDHFSYKKNNEANDSKTGNSNSYFSSSMKGLISLACPIECVAFGTTARA